MPRDVVFLTQKEAPTMARRRGHTEEQLLAALRHAEGGTTVVEVCREVGISEQTFSRWKRKYAGLRLSELRELRQLREENTKLKLLVADLSLDRHMVQEMVRKKLYGLGTGGRWPAGRKRPTRSVSAGSRGWCRWHGRRCGIRGIVIRRRRCAYGCERWR